MRFLAHIAHFHWDKLLGGKLEVYSSKRFWTQQRDFPSFCIKKSSQLRLMMLLICGRSLSCAQAGLDELWIEIDAFHGNMAKLKRRRNKLSRDFLPVTFSKQNNFLVSKSQFLLFLNLSNFRH